MKTLTALTLAAGLIAAGAAHASTDEAISDTERARITESVTAQGYEVRKMEREDGMIEVYAVKDGKRFELYVNGETGEIVKTKADD